MLGTAAQSKPTSRMHSSRPAFLLLVPPSRPRGIPVPVPTGTAEDVAGLRVPHPLQAPQQVLQGAVALSQELQEALCGAAMGLQHLQ